MQNRCDPTEDNIIEIDLNNLPYNFGTYHYSFMHGGADVAYAVFRDGQLTINMLKSDTEYTIRPFSEARYQGSVVVNAMNSSIYLDDGVLGIGGLTVNCSVIEISKQCLLIANTIEIRADDIENDGIVIAGEMAVVINDNQPGFVNYGDLRIKGALQQQNGTFENHGSIETGKTTVSNAEGFINHESGSHQTSIATINAKYSSHSGLTRAQEYDIHGEIINFQGTLSVGAASIRADNNAVVHPSAKINMHSLLCLAKNNAIFDGNLNGVDRLDVGARTIQLGETAHLDHCKSVKLYATDSISTHDESVVENCQEFTANANILLINGKLEAENSLIYKATQQCIFGQHSKSSSKQIGLDGKAIFLRGSMTGNVSCADDIQHIYLADSSIIKQCSTLSAKARLIEAYGNIESLLINLIADQLINTGIKTSFDSISTQLSSEHIRLIGTLNAENISAVAANQITSTPQLVLATKEGVKLAARNIMLEGNVAGSVTVNGDTVLNKASMNSGKDVSIEAKELLFNDETSSINDASIRLHSKNVIHDGTIDRAKHVEIKADSQLFVSRNSNSHSESIEVESEQFASIAGKVDTNQSSATKAKSLNFLKGADITSSQSAIIVGNSITGVVDVSAPTTIIKGESEIVLLDGHINASDHAILVGDNIAVGGEYNCKQVTFTKNSDEPSSLTVLPASRISTHMLSANHDNTRIAGNLKADEVRLCADDRIEFDNTSDVLITNNLIVRSDAGSVMLAGKMQVQAESAKKPEDKLNKKAGGIFIQANTATVGATATIQANTPVNIQSEAATLDGSILAQPLFVQAAHTAIGSHFVSDIQSTLYIHGKDKDVSDLTIDSGARIDGRAANFSNLRTMDVSGSIQTKEIIADVKDIHIHEDGKLGNPQSRVTATVEKFYHEGEIEAESASITCDLSFVQNGFTSGKGSINAKELIITSPIYINWFGKSEAQQAIFASFINLCASYKPTMINYCVTNTAVNLRMLPRLISVKYLGSVIDDIKTGKINIFSASYLQYSSQSLISLIRSFYPAIAAVASISMNGYFLCKNTNRLLNRMDGLSEVKLVDLLALLVDLKNIVSAASNVVADSMNLESMIEQPAMNYVLDAGHYLGHHFIDDVKDVPGNAADSVSNYFEQFTDQDKQPETVLGWGEVLSANWAEFNLNREIYTYDAMLRGADAARQVFAQYMMPPLSIIAPSYYDDALFSLNLGPTLTGVQVKRGIAVGSTCANTFGMSANSQQLFGIYDDDSHYVYSLNHSAPHVYVGDNNFSPIFSVHSKDFVLASGKKVRAHSAIIDVPDIKPYDIQAKNEYFKYSHADNESSFLQLKNEWSVFRSEDNNASVFYDSAHNLHLDQSYHLPWSVTYKAPGMTVSQGVNLKSDGLIGLVTTKSSLFMNGKLHAKAIYEESADKIFQSSGHAESKSLYMHALNTIDLDKSSIKADEGAIVSEWGDINNKGGSVEFKHFGYVDAVRGNVLAKCYDKNIITNDSPDKIYIGGAIMGGDGRGHNGLGLFLHGGKKVINDGGNIGAIGDYFVDGDLGVLATAPHNQYVYKHDHDTNIFGVRKTETVTTTRIQRPNFTSKNGGGYIHSKYGILDITSGKFAAKTTTKLASYNQPKFKVINSHTISHTEKKFGSVLPLSDNGNAEYKNIGQSFISPEGLILEARHGNIEVLDASYKTQHLVTKAWEGRTHLKQTPINHVNSARYLTFSLHAGPLNYTVSCNLDDPHQNKLSINDDLYQAANKAALAKNGEEKTSALVSAGSAAAGKVNSLMHGRYDEVIDTSLGAGLSYTQTNSYYQAPGENKLMIAQWDDYSCSVAETGYSGGIGQLNLHRASEFTMNGVALDYSNSSRMISAGASWNPFTDKISVSGSLSASKSHGRRYAPSELYVGNVRFYHPGSINLNNAILHTKSVTGMINQVNLKTEMDYSSQTASAISFSSDGGLTPSHYSSSSQDAPHPAEFHVDNLENASIHEINSHGGRLTGHGFDHYTPGTIHQAPLNTWHNETGFSLGFNWRSGSLASASFTNSYDCTTESIQLSGDGLSMHKDEWHNDASFALTVPYNLIDIANDLSSSSCLRQEYIVSESSPNKNNPHFLNEHDIVLLSNQSFSDPEMYADDIAWKPLCEHAENSSDTTPRSILSKSNSIFEVENPPNYINDPNSFHSDIFGVHRDKGNHDHGHVHRPELPTPSEQDEIMHEMRASRAKPSYYKSGMTLYSPNKLLIWDINAKPSSNMTYASPIIDSNLGLNLAPKMNLHNRTLGMNITGNGVKIENAPYNSLWGAENKIWELPKEAIYSRTISGSSFGGKLAKWGGRSYFYGCVAVDAWKLKNEFQLSRATGDYRNTYKEGLRLATAWDVSLASGALGAESGFMVGGPLGAAIGGIVGGTIGYITGEKGLEKSFNAIMPKQKRQLPIYTQMGNALFKNNSDIGSMEKPNPLNNSSILIFN